MDAALVLLLNRIAVRTARARVLTRLTATYLPVLMVAVFFVFVLLSFRFTTAIVWFGEAIAAGVVSRLVGTIIRSFVHRVRPRERLPVRPLITQSSLSLPSGHALFFSAFTVIVCAASMPLGIAFAFATLLVCIARVAAGIHYPSDMLVGVLIGVVVGIGFLHI